MQDAPHNPTGTGAVMFHFTYTDPVYPRVTQTCDSGAETAEAALKSIQRFIAREQRRRRKIGVPYPRIPKHIGELRTWSAEKRAYVAPDSVAA